jgi:hypothetical protein
MCVVMALLLSGCAGGSSPRPTGSSSPAAPAESVTAYVPPSGVYRIEAPAGWAKIGSPDGITFTGGLRSIRIEQIPSGSASTEASFRADELPYLRRSTRGFRLRRTGTIVLPAGTAVTADYTEIVTDAATGKPVERDVRRYELWHDDQRAVLTLSGLGDSALSHRVIESFRWRR